jgi:hypothetical protein
MASGDVVNGVGAVNTAINFQPAVGVECCITSAVVNTEWIRLTDGVEYGDMFYNSSLELSNCKIMITNTNYLNIKADGTESGSYTGIQIK